MKKIGILATHPIQYYAPLFRYLAKQSGVESTVYYCHKPNPKEQGEGFGVPFEWDIDLTSGYRHTWLHNRSARPSLFHFNGLDTPEIKERIAENNFDAFLVLGWHAKSMWQAMSACRNLCVPLLVRGDSHLHVKISYFKRWAKELSHRCLMRGFSACLAVGKWSEEYFNYYGAQRVIRSPHFVDNDWFSRKSSEEKSSAQRTRAEFGIPEEAVVFLFAGKFEEKKRPLDLLQALKQMFVQGMGRQDAHVLMVGDGAHRSNCETFARTHQLPVSFAGFLNQSQMPKAYAVSDILVLPSDGRETWGLVVNEAMACGLPAIVSDEVGCGPDLIFNGETGYVFPCGDIQALAEKMSDYVKRHHSGGMGDAARKIVSGYSVENAADGILCALEEIKKNG